MKWCGLGDFVADERLGFQLWEGRVYSGLARLRDQFTGRKRAKDSDRPHQPAAGARAFPPFWKNYNLPYDIINNPFNYTEKLERAGALHFAADVTDAPTNWACDAHHHE